MISRNLKRNSIAPTANRNEFSQSDTAFAPNFFPSKKIEGFRGRRQKAASSQNGNE